VYVPYMCAVAKHDMERYLPLRGFSLSSDDDECPEIMRWFSCLLAVSSNGSSLTLLNPFRVTLLNGRDPMEYLADYVNVISHQVRTMELRWSLFLLGKCSIFSD
jgi:hypothetical protein